MSKQVKKKSLGASVRKAPPSRVAGVPLPKKATAPSSRPSTRSREEDDYYISSKWFVFTPRPETHKHVSIHTNETIAVGVRTGLHIEPQSVALCGYFKNKAAAFNARLIADAGNTYRETGMLPSELAKRLAKASPKPNKKK